ncbi:MAG: 30S ribosomal protein S5 [Patescibacteria group bacterium]|nr:30S ribosomal protein S5 [Patescibacteria group bacterium]
MEDKDQKTNNEKKFKEKVLLVRRVSKKVPGGNYITFSALVAVGDRNGRVGIGLGSSLEVPPAIQKAINYAKKHLIKVPVVNKTLPVEIFCKYKAAKVLLKPAPEGTGLKVGSVARLILDLVGVENATGKIIGSRNQVANAQAVIKALDTLSRRYQVMKERKKLTQ